MALQVAPRLSTLHRFFEAASESSSHVGGVGVGEQAILSVRERTRLRRASLQAGDSGADLTSAKEGPGRTFRAPRGGARRGTKLFEPSGPSEASHGSAGSDEASLANPSSGTASSLHASLSGSALLYDLPTSRFAPCGPGR